MQGKSRVLPGLPRPCRPLGPGLSPLPHAPGMPPMGPLAAPYLPGPFVSVWLFTFQVQGPGEILSSHQQGSCLAVMVSDPLLPPPPPRPPIWGESSVFLFLPT